MSCRFIQFCCHKRSWKMTQRHLKKSTFVDPNTSDKYPPSHKKISGFVAINCPDISIKISPFIATNTAGKTPEVTSENDENVVSYSRLDCL